MANDISHAAREHRTSAKRGRTFWTWVLALLTIPGALAVVAYAYLQVLGTAACTGGPCEMGPSETVFGLIIYGTPVVAVVAVVAAIFTAKRRYGLWIQVAAWLLLVVATLVLATTFG